MLRIIDSIYLYELGPLMVSLTSSRHRGFFSFACILFGPSLNHRCILPVFHKDHDDIDAASTIPCKRASKESQRGSRSKSHGHNHKRQGYTSTIHSITHALNSHRDILHPAMKSHDQSITRLKVNQTPCTPALLFTDLFLLIWSLFLSSPFRQTFRTEPFPRGRRRQPNTGKMKPFPLTVFIVTRNHLTKRNLLTETIYL